MQRITEKMLEKRVEYLNRLVGKENAKYGTEGAYCLSYAYGGVELQQYVKEGSGCVNDVLRSGHCPKRETFNLINAYITGMTETGI